MKKFAIRFYGSGVYPEYSGIVGSISIEAVDIYVADEIANKMLDNRVAYYIENFDISEVCQ